MKRRSDVKNYQKVHSWIRYNYGKANRCENKECKVPSAKRFEWALITGKRYAKKIENFMPLCPSCHRNYDMTEEIKKNMSKHNVNGVKTHCMRGHKFTKDNLYPVKDKISGKIYRSCKTCVKQVRSRPEYKEHQREYWKGYVRKNKPVSRSPRKTLSK